MDAFARHGKQSLPASQLYFDPCSHHPLQNKSLAGSNRLGQLHNRSRVGDCVTSATNHVNLLHSSCKTRRASHQLGRRRTAWHLGKTERAFILLGNNQHGCKVYATRQNMLQRHYFFQTLTDKRWLNIAQSYPGKLGNLYFGFTSTVNLQPAIYQYKTSKI